MKAFHLLLAVLLTASAFAASPGKAPAEVRLYDLLARPAYLKSWNAMFQGEKNVDAWLAGYARRNDGPSAPEEPVQLGRIAYQAANVCKTRDCGDNRFYVLFAPGGTRAWGFLLKKGKDERFFGKPDEEKKSALRAMAAR